MADLRQRALALWAAGDWAASTRPHPAHVSKSMLMELGHPGTQGLLNADRRLRASRPCPVSCGLCRPAIPQLDNEMGSYDGADDAQRRRVLRRHACRRLSTARFQRSSNTAARRLSCARRAGRGPVAAGPDSMTAPRLAPVHGEAALLSGATIQCTWESHTPTLWSVDTGQSRAADR